jgi:hypothetical protein
MRKGMIAVLSIALAAVLPGLADARTYNDDGGRYGDRAMTSKRISSLSGTSTTCRPAVLVPGSPAPTPPQGTPRAKQSTSACQAAKPRSSAGSSPMIEWGA